MVVTVHQIFGESVRLWGVERFAKESRKIFFSQKTENSLKHFVNGKPQRLKDSMKHNEINSVYLCCSFALW
jgi:hypothetical protein